MSADSVKISASVIVRARYRMATGCLGLVLSGSITGSIVGSLSAPARAEVGSKPVKVAAVDFIPAWGDREGNIRRLVQAAERVAAQGVQYAVFPETAISGYDFTDPAQLAPFVDTIPGRATDALQPVLKRTGMIVSVGIAEKDANTGIFYNTAVLMGPDGIIGKYRKNGLNGQDVQLFGPGDTGVGVFDTPIGRIALIICYDDTYWQYDRLAALRGAQIIGWHSVSDRVMPGTPPAQARANHSTVASVQHMSALNGVWVIGATRSGIERNPINGSQLYYNGGSSIWSPEGRKLVQAPVVPPAVLPPRVERSHRHHDHPGRGRCGARATVGLPPACALQPSAGAAPCPRGHHRHRDAAPGAAGSRPVDGRSITADPQPAPGPGAAGAPRAHRFASRSAGG
ncbi:carbon-nitrogen hydrolase family protein [Synechococcus sp. GreenBA-s]|nr:carbon-nitrogen hydrolase family protein [Synechococcus sp. GreenBA-s]